MGAGRRHLGRSAPGKTYGSRRSEAVLQLTHDCRAQGIAVTGTPMLKSPAELAPLMEFTGQDVSVFGGLRQLLDHTCTLDRYGRLRPSRKGRTGCNRSCQVR